MRSLLNQVGIDPETRQVGGAPLSSQEDAPQQPDRDLGEVMGSFASPRRFGHYGLTRNVATMAYEPTNGLLAVASREGMIKVLGGPGVELVVEEERALAAVEDLPSHLVFPTPSVLVGITPMGGVLAWDLANGGRRCGHLPCPLDANSVEEGVTAVHCPRTPVSPSGDAGGTSLDEQYYVYLGLESGRVRVVQVFPTCRLSGYVVEAGPAASGAPDDLRAPRGSEGDGAGAVGAVTAIASSEEKYGGALVVIGYQYGAIMLWDWVRRKRLALHGLAMEVLSRTDEPGVGNGGSVDREVTSVGFHPNGEAFAAGFASGCYAIFPTAPCRDRSLPRWVSEVGDDGTFFREGPTVVRTPVSLVKWVRVKQRVEKAWGLLVAGGVEMEEGEDPDGVSLLVPVSDPSNEGGEHEQPAGGRRSKKQAEVIAAAAALAPLETAVFVPFAIGQESLSCVHAVMHGTGDSGEDVPTREQIRQDESSTELSPSVSSDDGLVEYGANKTGVVAEEHVDMTEELIILGLVDWTEEVRGHDGRLHFRHASSVQACPVQIAPYVALLQLRPERLGPHLCGFAPVTAIASTPLLSSCTILNFLTCLASVAQTWTPDRADSLSSKLLRGGGLRWAESVAEPARDEALCTSEMLVVGHVDGTLSFWECCGPVARSDGVCISDGRMEMREVPSGATLLGSLHSAELAGGSEGSRRTVTALDVWVERDHVAAAERDACWVAVGFGSGDAAVLVLSRKMQVDECSRGESTPLSDKPVAITNVDMSGIRDDQDRKKKGWKRFIGRNAQAPEVESFYEDTELEAAIAEARAEAFTIQAREQEGVHDKGNPRDEDSQPTDVKEVVSIEEEDVRQQASESQKTDVLHGSNGESTVATPLEPIRKSPEPVGVGEGGREAIGPTEEKTPREASLLQLALRLHGHPVRCIALSFDTCASALVLVVADAEGVVSVTDVATGSASLLPMRAPQVRPCHPAITIGPLPGALAGGSPRRGGQQNGRNQYGAAGALFVFLEGWLNVFDFASRDPIDFVEVPGLTLESRGSGYQQNNGMGGSVSSGRRVGHKAEENSTAWVYCVDERGVPLVPFASEPLSTFTPSPAHGSAVHQEVTRPDEEGCKGTGVKHGGSEQEAWSPHARGQTTIWVSPAASRTALEGYHEHELQILSGLTAPRPFFLIVHGAVAVMLAVAVRESAAVTAFARRPSVPSPNTVAAFKGRSGADLVVKSRVEIPPAEGRGSSPRVERTGVSLVAAGAGGGVHGKLPRRGCLIATDVSGFVTGLLLPSLSPVFRDRLPLGEDGGRRCTGDASSSQTSACNLVGEFSIYGTTELTRWSVLTDEACQAVLNSSQRLTKTPTVYQARTLPEHQPSDGGGASGSESTGSGSGAQHASRKTSAKRMLGRLSLGGSKKNLADMFAVDPPPPPAPRRQLSSGSTYSVTGGGGSVSERRPSSGDTHTNNRQALLGERGRDSRQSEGGVKGTRTARAAGGVGGAHAAASEAHDLAVERGEKLENMVDKSRQLEDSAMAFGDMAKQLRRQQEEEACCIA